MQIERERKIKKKRKRKKQTKVLSIAFLFDAVKAVVVVTVCCDHACIIV